METADLLHFSVTVHVFVALQRRLFKGYQLVHLNVDFSAGAEKISVTQRCHQGKETLGNYDVNPAELHGKEELLCAGFIW